MDIDPLADLPPPRHAIESDDEDEDERSLRTPQASSRRKLEVNITFKSESQDQGIERHVPLIVASGQAGNALARLLGHLSISSRVYANSIEIGYCIRPSQGNKYTVLISESDSSQGILPLAYMYPYARKVIDELQPSRVSILDVYSHPMYVSAEGAVYETPTVRYLLGTLDLSENEVMIDRLKEVFDTKSGIRLQTFCPPNLVHSTSAAFMNILAFPSFFPNSRNNDNRNSTVLMFLLPSPRAGLIPSMRPRYLGEVDRGEEEDNPRIGMPRPDYFEDEIPWSSEMLLKVVKGLFVSVGGSVDRELEDLLRSAHGLQNREVRASEPKKGKGRQGLGEVGESGMYI